MREAARPGLNDTGGLMLAKRAGAVVYQSRLGRGFMFKAVPRVTLLAGLLVVGISSASAQIDDWTAFAKISGAAAPAAAQNARWGADYFPNVTLTTQDGVPVRFYDDLIKGKIVAINLIYTTCKYACPLETARLAQVQKLLVGGEARILRRGRQRRRHCVFLEHQDRPARPNEQRDEEYDPGHAIIANQQPADEQRGDQSTRGQHAGEHGEPIGKQAGHGDRDRRELTLAGRNGQREIEPPRRDCQQARDDRDHPQRVGNPGERGPADQRVAPSPFE